MITRLLLITLIAFIPLTHAEVGDVYYCVMENADVLESPSGHRPAKLDKFTMRWQEQEISIREIGWDSAIPVVTSEKESFTAFSYRQHGIEYWSFKDGRVQRVYASNDLKSLVIVTTATCEKFD